MQIESVHTWLRPAIKLTAVSLTAFLSGNIFNYSYAVIPSLAEAKDDHAVATWRTAYRGGAKVMPPMVAFCGLSWSYLAYTASPSTNASTLYWLSAVLTPSIIPFTLIAMKNINGALSNKATKLVSPGSDSSVDKLGTDSKYAMQLEKTKSVQEMLQIWKGYNAIRSLMVGVAAVVGAWAVLGVESAVR